MLLIRLEDCEDEQMTFNEIYNKFQKLEEAVLVLSSTLLFVIRLNMNNMDSNLVRNFIKALDDSIQCIDDSRANTIKEDIKKIKTLI